MSIDITRIDKSLLLVALVNNHPLHINKKDITVEHAHRLGTELEWDFEYVDGVPVKINIAGDSTDTQLYDRDAYTGLAAHIISRLNHNK